MALKIRQSLFGDGNLVTSMTHEDLAYAIYVRDYSVGHFEEARCVICITGFFVNRMTTKQTLLHA